MPPPGKQLRSRPKALALALLAVYLPTTVPFVVGPLTSSSSSVDAYIGLLPVAPGFLLGAIATRDQQHTYWVAAVATGLIVCACYALARRIRARDLTAAFAVLMVLTAVQCHGLACMLRA